MIELLSYNLHAFKFAIYIYLLLLYIIIFIIYNIVTYLVGMIITAKFLYHGFK